VNPVILIPGIKGSGLDNFYPLSVSPSWSSWKAIAGPPLHDILLAANGEVDDADDITNRAGQLLAPAYGKFLDGLRGRLKVPVYVFPYDWRLSNKVNGARLVDFVESIRKKPMRAIAGWAAGPRSVSLIGHSMGGLVARAALGVWADERREAPPIDHLVFVATPHLGSLDAVKAMVVGDTPLLDFAKELRKLSRALPSVYELLPRFPGGAVVDPQGAPVDLFAVGNWQSNVTEPSNGIEDVTQERLNAAKDFFATLPSPVDKATPRYAVRGQVVCVYGRKKSSTLGRVSVIPVRRDRDGFQLRNWVDFGSHPQVDGDEVVPTFSAQLPGARGIEVPFEDVGWWPSELPARVSFHAFLCVLDEVQTLVASLLANPGRTDTQHLPLNLRAWT
jgi:pimeloyl-ACP methyl ester carboxylesterase